MTVDVSSAINQLILGGIMLPLHQPTIDQYARIPRILGPETEARVKWFNSEKGFGFVEMTDGSGEAFLHIRPVEAAGYSTLESGTTLMVRVGAGQKGPQVNEIVSVDASTAEPEPPRRAGPRPPMGGARPTGGRPAGGFQQQRPVQARRIRPQR